MAFGFEFRGLRVSGFRVWVLGFGRKSRRCPKHQKVVSLQMPALLEGCTHMYSIEGQTGRSRTSERAKGRERERERQRDRTERERERAETERP